jgi:hypothetical protein
MTAQSRIIKAHINENDRADLCITDHAHLLTQSRIPGCTECTRRRLRQKSKPSGLCAAILSGMDAGWPIASLCLQSFVFWNLWAVFCNVKKHCLRTTLDSLSPLSHHRTEQMTIDNAKPTCSKASMTQSSTVSIVTDGIQYFKGDRFVIF